MNSQYLQERCILCNHRLRVKEQSDWKRGDKTRKGYHPTVFAYYYCDGCAQTWLGNKNEKIE